MSFECLSASLALQEFFQAINYHFICNKKFCRNSVVIMRSYAGRDVNLICLN